MKLESHAPNLEIVHDTEQEFLGAKEAIQVIANMDVNTSIQELETTTLTLARSLEAIIMHEGEPVGNQLGRSALNTAEKRKLEFEQNDLTYSFSFDLDRNIICCSYEPKQEARQVIKEYKTWSHLPGSHAFSHKSNCYAEELVDGHIRYKYIPFKNTEDRAGFARMTQENAQAVVDFLNRPPTTPAETTYQ